MKLRVGDTVKVTLGKDRGKTGKVERIFPKKNRVLVAGVNIYKKHLKKQSGQAGRIVELFRPLDPAKLALICPHCHQPTRVGWLEAKPTKTRICKKCGQKL
jgi:large subunit ribosomal protein L24